MSLGPIQKVHYLADVIFTREFMPFIESEAATPDIARAWIVQEITESGWNDISPDDVYERLVDRVTQFHNVGYGVVVVATLGLREKFDVCIPDTLSKRKAA